MKKAKAKGLSHEAGKEEANDGGTAPVDTPETPSKRGKASKEKKGKSSKPNKNGSNEKDNEDDEEEEIAKPIDCRKNVPRASDEETEMSKQASSFLLGIHLGGSTDPSPALTPTSLLTLALSNEEKGISPALHAPDSDRSKTPETNELAVNFLNNIAFYGSITPQPDDTSNNNAEPAAEPLRAKRTKKEKDGKGEGKEKGKHKKSKSDKKKGILSMTSGIKALSHKHSHKLTHHKGKHRHKSESKQSSGKKKKKKKIRKSGGKRLELDNQDTSKMITYRGAPICCVSHTLVTKKDAHTHRHGKISGMLGKDNDDDGELFDRICGSNSIKTSGGFGSVSFCRLLCKSEESVSVGDVMPITDHPGLQSLDKVVVIAYPSFISSIREKYNKKSKKDTKNDLNRRFYFLYPKVQGTEVTFSSILRIRSKIIHLSANFLEVSTVALGLCYMEAVLKGRSGDLCLLNKRNFKTFAAACLYLAVKFNQDESKSTLKTTREKINKYMKISPETLVKYEFT